MRLSITLKRIAGNLKVRFLLLILISAVNAFASSKNFTLATPIDTVPKPCDARFTYNDAFNHMLTVQFYPSIIDSANTVVTWDFGDGTTSNLGYNMHQFPHSGPFNVCLTVQSTLDTSCHDRYCTTVTVKNPPGCTANYLYSVSPVNNKLIYFHNQSFPFDVTCSWDFGDGSTSTDKEAQHVFTTYGMHTVCLTIKSIYDSSCTNTHCDSINVGSIINCDSYFKIKKDSIDPHTIYLQNLSTGENFTCDWDFGDGTKSASINPGSHTYTTAGYYTINLSIKCKNEPNVGHVFGRGVAVSFDDSCKPLFTIRPDSSTTDPYDFILYNQSTGSNLSYLWFFGDDEHSTDKNPTHNYAGTGPYNVCLAVKNNNCYAEYCDTLSLNDTAHRTLSGSFHIKVVDRTVGINENAATNVSLQNYPNPFNDVTTIKYEVKEQAIVELSVFNILGSKLEVIENAKKNPGTYTVEWNAQNFHQGIYILQLRVGNQLISKKMIRN
ncbi:MAG TPA: PKD domain-containing protein [Bacteroidia bacterium]|jgi:PKD repeat protein|nr:PKD domain-containing protein [Bacteroidia bacterium]